MLQKLARPNPRPTNLSIDQLHMIVHTNQNWLVSMEELADTVDELDHLEVTLENLDQAGALNHGVGILAMERIQSLESITGRILGTLPSLESDTYSSEDFKDSVLPALQSVAQMTSKAYHDNFASVLTALSNVSLGSIHTAKSGLKRTDVLKQKLKAVDIKGSLEVALSGKNVGNAFTRDGKAVRELLPALKKDLAQAKILMEVIPAQVLAFANEFHKLVEGIDLDSDEGFKRTVLDKIQNLTHPIEAFSKKISPTEELLFNTSLYVVKKNAPKARGISNDYVHLADLATKQVVRERGGKPLQRSDSAKLTKSDLEALLECSADYCELVISGWGTYRKMSSALQRVMRSIQKLDYSAGELKSSDNIQALKQLVKISKHIPQYYRSPLADETDRCIKMALATRVVVSRAIKSDTPA